MTIVGENPYNGHKYCDNIGRKASKRLLLELSAYEGSTEMERKVIIDELPSKKITAQPKVLKTVQRVILQEIVIKNPSQAVLQKAMKKQPSLGDRVLIGEFHNRKGHVMASVEIMPDKLEKTSEALEDAIYSLLQTNSVRIQEVLCL